MVATDGPMHVPHRPALAEGRVRYVGEPVAFVVAETAFAAQDAAEVVEVDYDPLPCVVEAADALAAGRHCCGTTCRATSPSGSARATPSRCKRGWRRRRMS